MSMKIVPSAAVLGAEIAGVDLSRPLDAPTFAAMYGGAEYDKVKQVYDPDHRLTGLYEKAVGRR